MNLFNRLADKLDGCLWSGLDARAILIAVLLLVFLPAIIVLLRRGGKWLGDRRRTAESKWLGEEKEKPSGVIILTHGLNKNVAALAPLAEYLAKTPGYENYDIYLYDYAARIVSNAAPASLAIEMGADIDQIFAEKGKKDPDYEIILIGHSIGGLIMRKTWIDAVSEHLNDPEHEKFESSWAARVKKIVLLAAPNRGSSVYENNVFRRWLQYYPARILNIGNLGLSVLRGAEFMVNLRLKWIRTYQKLHEVPAVAQFVGRRDRTVSLDDSIDVVALPNAHQAEPFDDLDHSTILHSKACHIRVREFLMQGRPRAQVAGEQESYETKDKKEAGKVLVMHGIRDYGERFQAKIKPALERVLIDAGKLPIVIAPRYRYFTALSFLLPWTRERRVRKFVDEYSELLATPPQLAEIHFVGHSFGTYQLGAALRKYDGVNFGRVYLAGSVLREDFDWVKYLQADEDYVAERAGHVGDGPEERKPRVAALCNTAASRDWPVGILCPSVRLLKLSKLIGSGGFNGFTVDRENVVQLKYYSGNHGAAIDEADDWEVIGNWILADGNSFDPEAARVLLRQSDPGNLTDDRPGLWTSLHRWVPPIAALLVFLAVVLPWFLVSLPIWISPLAIVLVVAVTALI